MSSLSVEYARAGKNVNRVVSIGGRQFKTALCSPETSRGSACSDWMTSYLRGNPSKFLGDEISKEPLGLVDLFSGCGGFSLGAALAAQALGLTIEPLLAVDIDPVALDVYSRNLKPESVLTSSVNTLVDYQLWSDDGRTTFARQPRISASMLSFVGRTSIVIGGPPCQGHSGFNNHTRGKDDRNQLYLTVPAIGIALKAPIIIVENVYNVLNDKFKVVQHATELFESNGYSVASIKLLASSYGVAQTRKRHFLVASKFGCAKTTGAFDAFRTEPFTTGQAILDLADLEGASAFDRAARLSEKNVQRIKHLFDNNSYKLPNEVRPDCHKDGHTYPSVYGRLSSDGLANTVTTGFASPGRGRYVHPTKERALTAHEAARLQGFPDSFSFSSSSGRELTSKAYGKLIGDAVPPPLGFIPVMAALLTHPDFNTNQQSQAVGHIAEAQAA